MLGNMKYSKGLTKVSMARDGKAGLGISSGKENLAWKGMVSSKAEGEQMWESHWAPQDQQKRIFGLFGLSGLFSL